MIIWKIIDFYGFMVSWVSSRKEYIMVWGEHWWVLYWKVIVMLNDWSFWNDIALERNWKYDTNINLDIQIIKDGPGGSSWANGYQFEEAL